MKAKHQKFETINFINSSECVKIFKKNVHNNSTDSYYQEGLYLLINKNYLFNASFSLL